jgi:ubiquinone/menaquinone biosynthesis C-methylase UbiE
MSRPGPLTRAYDATWGRFFARTYDRMVADSEAAGMAARRGALLAGAAGRTLELGAGTGLNLERYPDSVEDLTLSEPFEPMAAQARERAAALGRRVEVVAAPGEALPFADASFDTVVATLVLCTVPDQAATLAEVRRVLAPGGRLLFIEHVRAEDPRLARWQDRLHAPWRFCGHGCHCNRDTLAALAAAGFELSELERFRLPKAPPIVRPGVSGTAIART